MIETLPNYDFAQIQNYAQLIEKILPTDTISALFREK